jgi:hypothetical protein
LPASCHKITEAIPDENFIEVSEAIPAKDAPTTLGCAGLNPAPLEEM